MPRTPLNASSVIDVAAQLADREGLDSLSIATLAEHLGVKSPSLYKHIDGLTGLRRELIVHAKSDLAAALARSAVGRSRSQALKELAATYRSWAQQHPGTYPLTVIPADPESPRDQQVSTELVELLAAVLAGYHFQEDALIHAIRHVRAVLHGFVDLEARGAFALAVDVEVSFALALESLIVALEGQAPATPR
ncbi:TetR/AcrR family transcriptional regulator [Populibacterium corticicola]|uniref:TetR/AcrR family transcriptional regulator n=1 Tax=Populibacterium corticicola TaxID=1812826 RepID=A0ABW5XGQ1_9MICO